MVDAPTLTVDDYVLLAVRVQILLIAGLCMANEASAMNWTPHNCHTISVRLVSVPKSLNIAWNTRRWSSQRRDRINHRKDADFVVFKFVRMADPMRKFYCQDSAPTVPEDIYILVATPICLKKTW